MEQQKRSGKRYTKSYNTLSSITCSRGLLLQSLKVFDCSLEHMWLPTFQFWSLDTFMITGIILCFNGPPSSYAFIFWVIDIFDHTMLRKYRHIVYGISIESIYPGGACLFCSNAVTKPGGKQVPYCHPSKWV